MKTLAILVAALAIVAASRKAIKYGSKPNPRIVGGHEAEPHSIPYQAYLNITLNIGTRNCGGSLVSETAVLTAAHCISDALLVQVVLGAHNIHETEDTQVIVTSSNLVVHPDYNENIIANDIGIVKLTSPVTLTDAIQIVSIADDPANNYEGSNAIYSGYGTTDNPQGTPSDVLNVAEAVVISNDECATSFDIQEDNICTGGEDNTSGCSGDGGSPLTVDGVQVGIVSYGDDNCVLGLPSVHTRITSHIDFINENLD